jgi:threonine/homoserine/homoserine lactone efflux protein
MSIDNYLAYLLVAFLTITSPGAAILLAITNAMRYELKAVLYSTLGNILGLFLLSLAAMLGVGTLLKLYPALLGALKIIGALYLIYLGIKQILNKHKVTIASLHHSDGGYSPYAIFRQGFLIAATNPKPILFFSAIFPLFLSPEYSAISQFFIMTFTFMAISFASLMGYGYLSTVAKAWFLDEAKLRVFFRISGTIFVMMGIGMALWH